MTRIRINPNPNHPLKKQINAPAMTAKQFRAARIALDMSLQDMGDYLGLSVTAIHQKEKSIRPLSRPQSHAVKKLLIDAWHQQHGDECRVPGGVAALIRAIET